MWKPSKPAEAPDCLLVGPARSGTTLACALLNKRQNVLALDEPYRRSAIQAIGPDDIARFVSSELLRQRRRIERTGRAESTVVDSSLGNHYRTADRPQQPGETRERLAKLGELAAPTDDVENLRLVVKHTFLFAANVDLLATEHSMYALVRNPLAVLLSWNSIDADYRLGRVPGYVRHHAPELVRRLAEIEDRLTRQVELLSWHFARFDRLAEDHAVIRYEDIVASNGRCLDRIAAGAAEAGPTIRDGNIRPADPRLVEQLTDRLSLTGGPLRQHYRPADIAELATRLTTSTDEPGDPQP